MGRVVSVVCASHTPALMVPPERWDVIYDFATSNRTSPPPKQLADETPEVNAQNYTACMNALARLRASLHESKPDVVIMFGDDQRENFTHQFMPPFCVFTGDTTFGYPFKLLKGYFGEPPGERINVKCDSALANQLVQNAFNYGFDLPWSTEFSDTEWGLPHSMIRLVHHLDIDFPIIPIHINAFHEPAPPALRCFELGKALNSIIEKATPKEYRVALVGSGGMSHRSRGPNAGFIDADHDQWALEVLRKGEGSQFSKLTNEELRSVANEELRNWIACFGFIGDRISDYLDYVLAYRSLSGMAFAAWQLD